MTESNAKRPAIGILTGTVLLFIVVLLSPQPIVDGIRKGMQLCGRSVIPAVFPSMVLSDLLVTELAAMPIQKPGVRLWIPVLLGALCGFPIGVKSTCELYSAGEFNRKTAQKLLQLAGNTGPAFVVACVGGSFFGDERIGWILYFSQLLACALAALLYTNKGNPNNYFTDRKTVTDREGGLVAAVRHSVFSMLAVCGFVVLFAAICQEISTYLTNVALKNVLFSFLEVTSCAAASAEWFASSPLAAIAFASFSLSFSGISVLLQSAAILKSTDLALHPFIVSKFLQGVLSVPISLLLFNIFH